MGKVKELIIDIPGGFGNQLFGYAFGYALSREIGCRYYIHTPFQDNGITWDLQLNYFNLKHDGQITYKWTKKFLDRAIWNKLRRRIRVGFFTPFIYENKEWELIDYVDELNHHEKLMCFGNWETERFIKKYRDEIISMLTLKEKRSDEAERLFESLKNNDLSVGVHIRRGDKAQMGCSLAATYYNNAIAKMYELLGDNAEFYIISDDIQWCKENIKHDKARIIYPVVKSNNQTLDDWLILRNCNNHIVANSTFSWWAAWLCEYMGQRVIAPNEMKYRLDDWIGM